MNFVTIYGPPGVGKLTVATELSRLTGSKLFDNHVSIDWALNFFDFGADGFWDLVHSFRRSVIRECTRADIDLVFTCVYHIEDVAVFKERCEIVEENGGTVCLVRLICKQPELERRVESPDRIIHKKLASVGALNDVMQRFDLTASVPGRDSLVIDNTDILPTEAAQRIAAHYGLTAQQEL